MPPLLQALTRPLLRAVPWRLRSFNNLVLASPNPFFAGVLSTPPAKLAADADTEIHALVCHRDLNMMLTSAKSLLRFCPPISLVLHDDGSLTADDEAVLLHHLPGAHIIRRASADEAMRLVLPHDVFLKRAKHFFLLKLFDFNYFNRGGRTITLDSDILFLRRPDEIVDWLRDPQPAPFFNRDISPSYRATHRPSDFELPVNLNAGLMGYMGRFEVTDITHWCRELDYWLEDQTIYAVLLANRGAKALDPDRYRVYAGEGITPQTVMVHFISPQRFDRLLYPRLARKVHQELRSVAS